LAAPRIAVMHNWQSTAQDGWYRISLDELKIPYTYIADTTLRQTADLRSKFDVIIVPPVGYSLTSMLSGVSGAKPIPWQNTPDMPDLAPPGLDSTPDIRGGLGLAGVEHLEQFVNAGGLLVAVGPSMALATDTGMAEGVSTRQPPQGPEGLNARGDVLRAEVSDANSPIAYGYNPALDVYYSTGLLLATGGGGRGGFGGRGGASGRTSGIGSLTEPNVFQSRPSDAALLKESLGGHNPTPAELAAGRGGFGRGAAVGPPPRVIVRFVPDAHDLLLSGLLVGGQAIAGQPLLVDARHGQGHILLFAGNPFWRNETSGEFSLLLNAAMNYQSLNVGTPAPGRGGRGRGRRGGR
ncbi:MAG TPA: hypothetical protein VNF74_00435, partial [Terriglobales bacterium]|nr:hypothetical protein [Terriglobales bacterium]